MKEKNYKKNEAEMIKEQETNQQLEVSVKQLKHELKTKNALLRKCEKEYTPLEQNRRNLLAELETLRVDLQLANKSYEELRAEVEENKKRIESKMRERDLLNKDVVVSEEKEREESDVIQTLEGELKKLQNKI